MRCLWLTWIDPHPEHDGQRIYSGRLIETFANAGGVVDVLCSAHARSLRKDGELEGQTRWWLTVPTLRSSRMSVFSRLPHVAYRSNTREMRDRLPRLLRHEEWECIVFDGLYAGWALDICRRFYRNDPRRPRFVYVAHNHETTTRAALMANYRGSRLKRYALSRDSKKVRRLEKRMVSNVDLVTAITADDAALFATQSPNKPTLVLTPGYQGPSLADRTISADLPRRVVIVGSFEWIAKQANLEEFLSVADPLFSAAKVELEVIGNGTPRFFEKLAVDLSATKLVGRVDRVDRYLKDARLAIVAERLGGGFKLKVLDYVFNRVPVAALNGAVAGTPLRPHESILTFANMPQLVNGVIKVIDDLDLLNRLQKQAFADCSAQFRWSTRGEQLLNAIAAA